MRKYFYLFFVVGSIHKHKNIKAEDNRPIWTHVLFPAKQSSFTHGNSIHLNNKKLFFYLYPNLNKK